MSLKTTFTLSLLLTAATWMLGLVFELNVLLFLVLFDIIFWLSNRNKKRLFYFTLSRFLTFALYVSYLVETGMPYSYGGDDFGIMTRHLSRLTPYTLSELFSGSFLNYPLFYFINLYFIRLIQWISFDYQHILLCTLNSFIFAEMMLKINRIGRVYNLNSINKLLLFTPLIYFSSIFLRDIYVYYCYISVYYIFEVSKERKYNVLWFILISSLIRPESSILLILFVLLSLKKTYALAFTLVTFYISWLSFDEISVLFRNYDQLQDIYFSSSNGNTNMSGLAVKIQQLPGIFGKVLWFIYNMFKPLPPFIVNNFTFENVILLVGNIFQYVFVLFIFTTPFIKTLLKRRDLLLLLFSIGIVAFIGGTQRHMVHFYIPIALAFYSTTVAYKKKLYATGIMLAPLLVTIYLLVR